MENHVACSEAHYGIWMRGSVIKELGNGFHGFFSTAETLPGACGEGQEPLFGQAERPGAGCRQERAEQQPFRGDDVDRAGIAARRAWLARSPDVPLELSLT